MTPEQPVVKVWRRTETGEAPRGQGATTENTGLYLKEEQRSPRGCIARRMQPDFHHGLLGAPPSDLSLPNLRAFRQATHCGIKKK